jgi:glutamine cyclotransferase
MTRLRLVLALPLLWMLSLAPGVALADIPASVAQVVASYPHDTKAFTEGLIFKDGVLYESTGYEGHSNIRKVDLATGTVLGHVDLPPGLFGEGIVDWGDQLISVTWHGGQGFRWDRKSLRRLGSWRYTGEGWALTQDGKNLILSDGTPVLRFLDPRTLKVVRTLKVTADGKPVPRLNELEYVKGEILANIWMTRAIARIDPKTGRVKGWIDLGPLWRQVQVSDTDAVPNGIAYDKAHDRLFVTGKYWPTLFQIKY